MTDILKYLDEDGVTWKPFTTAVGDAASIGGATLPAILDAIFPVGSVYVSGSDTMPALIASIGTWVRLDGRVIVGVDASQTEFDTVNKTGGAKTHTLTTAEMPYHGHELKQALSGTGGGVNAIYSYGYLASANGTVISIGSPPPTSGELRAGVMPAGGGGAHNNLQPYKTKYMWERTA